MPATTLLIALVAALGAGASQHSDRLPAAPGAGGRTMLSDDAISAEQRTPRLVADETLERYLESHTVVFVGGFLNEYVRHRLTGSYFRQNVAALKEVVPGVATLRVFPPSRRGMADNVDWLRDRLEDAWRRGGRRPLVVIAHSKGGAEALLTLLQHPDLASDGVVEELVLIQSSVGGSPIADCLADPDACRPPSRLMRLAGRWLWHSYRDGLISLGTDEARRLFAAALEEARARGGADGLERLSARVSYVRAVAPVDEVSRRLRPASTFLAGAGFPRNDGMLALQDQLLDRVGTDLGEVLTAAHADLVCSGWGVSRRSRGYRAAFTRLLFAALAVRDRSGPPSASRTSPSPAGPCGPDRRSPP